MTAVPEQAVHADLSPSGAHRWMRCPGSVEACRDYPRTSNPAAATGTLCHEIAAMCLETGEDAVKYAGTSHDIDGTQMVFEDEFVEPVQQYIDRCREYLA